MWIAIAVLADALVCAGLCYRVAKAKRLNTTNWLLAGLFFGILGLVALAAMPQASEAPREEASFAKAMLVVLLAWAGLLVILYFAFGAGPKRGLERDEPSLPVYEGATHRREQRSETIGWHNLTYRVSLEYPSLAVYHFCDRRLQQQGWTREVPQAEAPIWRSRPEGKKRFWVAQGQWRDKRGIYRIQLELLSTERVREGLPGEMTSEGHEPGIIVSCTSRRIMFPE